MLRLETRVLLSALLLAGCGGEGSNETGAPAIEQPAIPKPETGGCQNENLIGECHYMIKIALDPTPGDPPGTVVYQIEHEIHVRGEDRQIPLTSLYLRIPADKAEELEAFFRSADPVDCTAYIVRPPCNPDATSLTLALDPPPFAEPVRR